MANPEVIVGDKWLTELCRWGDLSYELDWPGDCIAASFQITTRYQAHHPLFHRSTPVTINRNGSLLWAGTLQEPEWNGREAQINVVGLYRQGEAYSAFDGSGNAIDNLADAMDAQIARGLPWRRHSSIPVVDLLAGDTERQNSIAALADEVALHYGMHWGVNPRGVAYMAAPPVLAPPRPGVTLTDTRVWYHVHVGAADLSTSEDNFASHVLLRYVDPAETYKTAAYPPVADPANRYENRWGHYDWRRDITDLGELADATALTLAQTIYERSKLKPAFNSGLELLPGELVTEGGVPVDFDAVRPNRVVRAHGVRDELTGVPYTDFVLGNIKRSPRTSKTIQIAPVGVASRDPEAVWVEMLEQATNESEPA